MNGLKNGENISKYVKGAEGILALSSSGDFTPLASVLSTTVAQSDTVSPQKKKQSLWPKSQIRRTKNIYRNLKPIGTLYLLLKLSTLTKNGHKNNNFYNP